MNADFRRRAVEQAIASNALSDFHPSDFCRSVLDQWVDGQWTTDDAVALVIQHHKQNPWSDSDDAAQENKLGITDSRQLQTLQADITTLRMAELVINPV